MGYGPRSATLAGSSRSAGRVRPRVDVQRSPLAALSPATGSTTGPATGPANVPDGLPGGLTFSGRYRPATSAEREVAGDLMGCAIVEHAPQWRLLVGAALGRERATGNEPASRRGPDGRGRFAAQDDALALSLKVGVGDR